MKKILFLTGFVLFSISSFAQIFADNKNINELDIIWCQIAVAEYDKGRMAIDYGQENKIFKNSYITNEKGKIVEFNSNVHLLNYMEKNKWQLEDVVSTENSIIYIFKKSDDNLGYFRDE